MKRPKAFSAPIYDRYPVIMRCDRPRFYKDLFTIEMFSLMNRKLHVLNRINY